MFLEVLAYHQSGDNSGLQGLADPEHKYFAVNYFHHESALLFKDY